MVIKTIFFKMCLTILWSITKIQIHHINIQNYIFIDGLIFYRFCMILLMKYPFQTRNLFFDSFTQLPPTHLYLLFKIWPIEY
jgi:hypothetical protein